MSWEMDAQQGRLRESLARFSCSLCFVAARVKKTVF